MERLINPSDKTYFPKVSSVYGGTMESMKVTDPKLAEYVAKLKEFLHEKYFQAMVQAANESRPAVVSFRDLYKFRPAIAELLADRPDDFFEAAGQAVEQIDLPAPVRVRIADMPDVVSVRDLRSRHVGKFIAVEGIVRRASEIRPEIMNTIWECAECGDSITQERKGSFIFKPMQCKCGSRKGFKETDKKMIDTRWITIEEPFELTEGERPSQVNIWLTEDLVSVEGRRMTEPGNRLRITGVLRDVPKGKSFSAKLDFFLEANHATATEIGWEKIKITKKDEEDIRKLAADDNVYEILVDSLAPTLYGMREIKEAVIMQLFGGVQRIMPDRTRTRGEIHILLIGDPASGKSQLLKLVPQIVPRGKYVSGKGTTTAGLCTTYDSLIQLGNGGIVKIGDLVEKELEKGSKEIDDGVFISQNPAELEIVSFDQAALKVTKKRITQYFKIRAPKSLVRITTRTGRTVTVTPENPIPILKKGEVIWRKAADITAGEYITCPRILPGANKADSLLESIDGSSHMLNGSEMIEHLACRIKETSTIREFSRKHGIEENNLYHFWRKADAGGKPRVSQLRTMCLGLGLDAEQVFPEEIVLSQYNGHQITMKKDVSEDLMYLIGLIGGDGSISRTPFGGFDIKFANAEDSMLAAFSRLCKEQLGISPRREKSLDRVPNIRFASKIFAGVLDAFGIPPGKKAHNIHVTEKLSLLPNHLLKGYLQGMFDTDGCANPRKTGGSSIELDSVSKELIEGVQLLLLRFGIISRVRKRKATLSSIKGRPVISKEKYTLEISGSENIRKFEDAVGFRLQRKAEKLRQMAGWKHNTKENIDVIPSIGGIIRKARKSLGISARSLYGYKNYSYETGERNATRGYLKNVATRMKEKGYNDDVKRVERFAFSDMLWDKLKSVELLKNHEHEWVYDVTVDGEHSFVCNGMVIHNTATVSKDEQFMGGWVLEAGAMVMAHRGLLSVDEFEKMAPEDQVAMHEALEQGCYDGGTEIILEDGSVEKLGDFVDKFTKDEAGEKIAKDISDKDIYLLSSDFRQVRFSKAKAVGKHIENKMFHVRLNTGQDIAITPNHPVFIVREGRIIPIKAEELKAGDCIPVPKRLSLAGKPQLLPAQKTHQDKKHKQIRFPEKSSPELCEWIGLVLAEGNAEVNRKSKNGVCFTNTDGDILERYKQLIATAFKLTPYAQKNRNNVTMLRVISKPLHDFVHSIGPSILARSWDKEIPEWVNKASNSEIAHLLRGLFDGEGSVNHTYGTITFSTTSRKLARQIQQLLLRFEVFSGIYDDRSMKGKRKHKAYKLQISGKENIRNFAEFIGFAGKRRHRLEKLLKKKTVSSLWNHVPNIMPSIEEVRKSLGLSYDEIAGHEMTGARRRNSTSKEMLAMIVRAFEERLLELEAILKETEKPLSYRDFRRLREKAGISRSEIARELGVSQQVFRKRLAGMLSNRAAVENLRFILDAPVEWVRVKDISAREGKQWVYDVEMNPTGIFIGNGIICHNSVSIAKASIVATLPAQTSVLAGGNPKFSRFDPYLSISKQITIPDTLLTRFDLKFALKDVPDSEVDKKVVDHMIRSRHADYEGAKPKLEAEFIRRYIAYAKDNCKPDLTEEAEKMLKKFYISTRKKAEGGGAPVPITLRQFEATIRLSEAAAKIQLSQQVKKEHAQRAIKLMRFSLRQLGFDPETGAIDIDKTEGGVTATERSRIRIVLDILNELSQKKKEIAIADLQERARKEGVEDIDEVVDRLKREGMLFEPSPGFVQKV
ncbi:MAG: hypothetical protein HY518_02875 [Candidatus Aenigmarchaeota archaeon]|nr:hypothetical protein [Candidatus Aenigmarchaeota archaeon]